MRFPFISSRFLVALLLAAAAILLKPMPAQAADTAPPSVVLVAAAADLQYALPELAKVYEAAHPGVKISASFGSSGKFYEQINQGAPFDLFLSADASFPRKLIEAGKGVEGDFFLYAVGHLVVWVPKTSPLAVTEKGIQVLLDPLVKKIAIANPEHAPYGRAAVAAMQKLGVYEAVKDRLVLGENVAQAAQFVQTGAADVGIIGLSLALGAKMQAEGKYAEIPLEAFPKLEQGGLILPGGKNAAGARAFKNWLRGGEARKILQSHGFALPD